MKLERTAAVLEAVQEATASGDLDGATQSFLVQYTAIVLYSDMEERVGEIIRDRLEQYSHRAIAQFLVKNMAGFIKRTSKTDIADLTGRFGDEFKDAFNGLVEDRYVARYSNVIEARHDVGHRRGSSITLSEVRDGHEAANHILEALNKCFDNLGGEANVPAIATPASAQPA